MDNLIDGGALLRVVVVSLLLGTTIPAVFALGVRALATVGGAPQRPAIRTLVGYLCFAAAAAAVILGIYSIVQAK